MGELLKLFGTVLAVLVGISLLSFLTEIAVDKVFELIGRLYERHK